MSFIPLHLPHTDWRQFEEQVRQVPNLQNDDDWYHVESLASGVWVCIQKNGHTGKSQDSIRKTGRPLPNDYLLRLYDPTTLTRVWTPQYPAGGDDVRPYKAGLMPDLHTKLATNRSLGEDLITTLYDVAAGAEPSQMAGRIAAFHALPGRPADEILYIFKWLLAQEGVNYPIAERKQGRKYPLYRIQEIVDGVDIGTVISRCQIRGYPPSNLPTVNYKRVDARLGL